MIETGRGKLVLKVGDLAARSARCPGGSFVLMKDWERTTGNPEAIPPQKSASRTRSPFLDSFRFADNPLIRGARFFGVAGRLDKITERWKSSIELEETGGLKRPSALELPAGATRSQLLLLPILRGSGNEICHRLRL
jgi:hypothetical protein